MKSADSRDKRTDDSFVDKGKPDDERVNNRLEGNALATIDAMISAED